MEDRRRNHWGWGYEDERLSSAEVRAAAGGRGEVEGRRTSGDAVGSWLEAFLRAPYIRDVFVAAGVVSETFETAITWERFPAFHEQVRAAAEQAMREVGADPGGVSCRFTHVYPDGPAPYHTVLVESSGSDAAHAARARGWGS